MSSYRQAQAIIQSGHPEGWGRVLDLPTQKDKKGLGFVANHRRSVIILGDQSIPPLIQFISGRTIQGEAHAVDEADGNNCEMDRWVHPTGPNEKHGNWFAKDIIEVTRLEE